MTYTKGPWTLCHHLQSERADKSCSCGYRGGIWGSDGRGVICEMGATIISGEEDLSLPRYDRNTELYNARLISKSPELFEALHHCLGLLQELPTPDYMVETVGNALMNYQNLINESITLIERIEEPINIQMAKLLKKK